MKIRGLAILGIVFLIIMAITIYIVDVKSNINPVSAFYITVILLVFTLVVEFLIGQAMFKASF